MRTKATTGSKNVNAWLNFKADDDDERPERGGQKRDKFQKPQRNVLKDKEGVDFGYYFTQKYQMSHQRKGGAKPNKEERPQTAQPKAKDSEK